MQSNTSTKIFSVLCYLTVVGWIISFLLRDKEDVVVKHHLNQGLILILAAIIFGAIGQFGGIFGLFRRKRALGDDRAGGRPAAHLRVGSSAARHAASFSA